MNKTKRILCAAAAAALAVSAFALSGCTTGERSAKYKVYMPDGAPAIALSSLMYNGYADAEFTVVPTNAKTTIVQHVAKGDADFAILPVNAAATLYNKGTQIVMMSVNTHGNLYVIGDGEATDLGGLVGKRLGVIGQGNVPEHALKMLLDKSGTEYVEANDATDGKIAIRYVGAGTDLAQLFKKGEIDYGYLAEPAVSTLSASLNKNVVMDVQAQWRTAFGGEFPQACLVAKKSIVENDKAAADAFLAAVKESDGWAEANPDKAVEAVKSHMEENTTSTLTTLTQKSIKGCNIKTTAALEAKEACGTYFEKLASMKSVLGAVIDKVPDNGFYYKG